MLETRVRNTNTGYSLSLGTGGTPIVGGTVGSVLFIGAGPVLAQNNAQFFWDNANNRLGIGTASPASGYILDARGNLRLGTGGDIGSSRSVLTFNQGGWGLPAAAGSTSTGDKIVLYDPGATYRLAQGMDSSARWWFQSQGGTAGGFSWWTGSTPTQLMVLQGDGNVGIGTTSPLGQLHVKAVTGTSMPVIDGGSGIWGSGIQFAMGGSSTVRLDANQGSGVLGIQAPASGTTLFLDASTTNPQVKSYNASTSTLWLASYNGTSYVNTLGVINNLVTSTPASGTSSGVANLFSITPTTTQSGTAGYTGLLVNATETTTGSGTKRLLDLQVGGTSQFSVSNLGVTVMGKANQGTGHTAYGSMTITGDAGFLGAGILFRMGSSGTVNLDGNAGTGVLGIQSPGSGTTLFLDASGTDPAIKSYNASTSTLWLASHNGTSYVNTLGVINGRATITPEAKTSGSPVGLTFTGPAHTTLTASTEASDVNLNLARTVQFATGALTTQRAVRIQAPTYGFVAASTITNAATLHIDAAPTAGTNATITNAYALWLDAGSARFDGVLLAELGSASNAAYSFQSAGTADADTGMFSSGANTVNFSVAGSEAARFANITGGGVTTPRLLIGQTTLYGDQSRKFAIASSGGAGTNGGMDYSSWNTSSGNGPVLEWQRSKSSTVGTHTAVVSGDFLGGMQWVGSDGTAFATAANIFGLVDGTVSANKVPGRLVFQTTAVGDTSPTERIRVTNAGLVGINTGSPNTTLHVNGGFSVGLVSKTAAYTATTSDSVILCSDAAGSFTVTLPAATNKGMIVRVVKTNASANTVTVAAAGTDTIEGAASIGIGVQYQKVQLVADGVATWYNLGTGNI